MPWDRCSSLLEHDLCSRLQHHKLLLLCYKSFKLIIEGKDWKKESSFHQGGVLRCDFSWNNVINATANPLNLPDHKERKCSRREVQWAWDLLQHRRAGSSALGSQTNSIMILPGITSGNASPLPHAGPYTMCIHSYSPHHVNWNLSQIILCTFMWGLLGRWDDLGIHSNTIPKVKYENCTCWKHSAYHCI